MKQYINAPLKDVAYFQEGPGLRNWQYGDSGIPFLNIRTIRDDGFIDRKLCQFVKQDEFEGKYEHFLLDEGDYVVSSSGTLGKLAEVRVQDLPLMLNTSVIRFRPIDQNILNRVYLKWFIKSPLYLEEVKRASTGIAIKNYGPSHLKKMTIPLPPISEQRRIVEVLDQADALRKKRAEADEKSDRILPALFIQMFGDPVENSMGWELVEMKSLYKISPNYGTMIPAKSDEGEWLDLRVANIQNGCLDLSSKKYVDLPVGEIKRYEVLDGDLLVTRAIGSADHLGKCIVAYPGKEKWAFDSHLMRVRFDKKLVHPEFIRNFLLNPSGRQIFLQKTRKSAVQFNINTKEFGSIVLPLPPLKLQLRFVEEFEKLNIIQSKRYWSKKYLENLFNTCLYQAFSGDLTAEWRKAHMNEILQEMEHQSKVLGIPHTVEYEQLALSDLP